jgi:xanthine dehydrogenase YagR molybdenum-binding subunit
MSGTKFVPGTHSKSVPGINSAAVGRPLDRVDGPAKTSGSARYAAEFSPSNVAYAVMVQSTIPAGR